MNAEVLTYSHSNGAFAGVALKGRAIHPDAEANPGVLRTDEPFWLC